MSERDLSQRIIRSRGASEGSRAPSAERFNLLEVEIVARAMIRQARSTVEELTRRRANACPGR